MYKYCMNITSTLFNWLYAQFLPSAFTEQQKYSKCVIKTQNHYTFMKTLPSSLTCPFRFHIGEHLWLLSSKFSHVTLSAERLLSLPEDWTLDKLPFSLVLFRPLIRRDLVSVDRDEMDEVLFGTSGGIFWPWHHGRWGGVPDFGAQLSCLFQDALFWWSGDVAMARRNDKSRFRALSCPNYKRMTVITWVPDMIHQTDI